MIKPHLFHPDRPHATDRMEERLCLFRLSALVIQENAFDREDSAAQWADHGGLGLVCFSRFVLSCHITHSTI